MNRPTYRVSITVPLEFIIHFTLLLHWLDVFLKRLKCRSGGEDGSDLDRVKAMHNQPNDIIRKKLADSPNPKDIHIYRTF